MAPVSDVEVEVSDQGGRGRKGGVLSLDDCRCPVCLEIFMEPVTLPCTHTFCKDCFLESVDKSTLCCPLCRKRVSTWARLHSRNNTLVNQQLWTQIQASFPLQCQRRVSGQDGAFDDDLGVSVCFPRVSRPGELRQEYEDQITKLTEEKRVLDEEERRASEEYIQRLLAEEEELLQEERRRREDDERLARLLSDQLNSAAVSRKSVRPADVTPAKKKKEVSAGHIERSDASACSFTANKEDILLSEAKLHAQSPLTSKDTSEPPDLHPTAPSASVEVQLHHQSLRSHMTTDGGPSSAKRKSSEVETTEDKEVIAKRVCHTTTFSSCRSSSSAASPYALEVEGSALHGIAKWETELLSRQQQQEEEDWRLALLLQKELDQEEKQRATDRRKGSSDAYQLRQNHREKVEASSSNTPCRNLTLSPAPSAKTTKTSTLSPAPSAKTTKTSTSSTGSKQTTLTEMFSLSS